MKYSIEDFRKMSKSFNKMSFSEKIKTIKNNPDLLVLASDHNWWGVKAKDKDIQEQLEDEDTIFEIVNEWDSSEIHDLVYLLGLNVTDI